MTKRYVRLKGQSSAARLKAANETTADELADEFVASANAFAAFETDQEFFPANPRRDRDKNPKSATRTYGWAMAMKNTQPRIAVEEDPQLDFTYVEREIQPTRTKPGRSFDSPKGKHVQVDLLLANAGTRRPIVGELKIERDKDPFSGLIQGLAGAAQLVSSSQRARLSNLRRPIASFDEDPLLDVYVLLAKFPETNRHRFQQLEAAGIRGAPAGRSGTGRLTAQAISLSASCVPVPHLLRRL